LVISKFACALKIFVPLLLFSFSTAVYSQHITVLDSISQEPIPFVHIYDGNKGVISSSLGAFYWQSNAADSISFSCMGYGTKKIGVDQLKDTLFLIPKAWTLAPIVVSNRTLAAKEIMARALENTEKNMGFGLYSSEVYVVTKNKSVIQKMNIEIKKSTILELDQTFVDEIIQEIPRNQKSSYYVQSMWLRDSGGLKNHKLEVTKAASLQDSLAEANYTSMEETIQGVLKERVKNDSYFKVKSGPLISVKIDNDNAKEADSTTQDSLGITSEAYANKQLGVLKRKVNSLLFKEKKWALPFLDKPNKYKLTNEGVVYDQRVPTYKLRFTSKKKKDYSGYILVDVVDFGIHKISYQNNKHAIRIKLFGLFFEERLDKRTYVFIKNQLDKYTLYNMSENYTRKMGIKRPFKIIEKNKFVKGRNRQNILSMDINYSGISSTKRDIYFNSFKTISKRTFDAFKATHSVTPTDYYSLDEIGEIMPGLPIQ
jgi:hypothetical protein|tara:strand:+ start:506 stop:1957 length:1452 start_codon:yes stop_codon:yes gene_type:complete